MYCRQYVRRNIHVTSCWFVVANVMSLRREYPCFHDISLTSSIHTAWREGRPLHVPLSPTFTMETCEGQPQGHLGVLPPRAEMTIIREDRG